MSSAASPALEASVQALSSNPLMRRLTDLWNRCLLPGAESDPVLIWSALEARYGEAHRHYHDKEHLAHCPDQLDLATRAMDHPDRVEMAIWFHDIVNDPGREDNEARNNIQRLLAQMQGRTG